MSDQRISPFHFAPLDINSRAQLASAISTPDANASEAKVLLQAECEALREAARREGFALGHTEGLEVGRTAGYEEGLSQGRDAGYREGMLQAEESVALLSEAARQWRTADASIAAFLERTVLQLSLDVARQVILQEVSSTTVAKLNSRLEGLIETLHLSRVSVTWALHPDQIAILEAHLSDLPPAWTFHADERMSLGGVRVRAQWPDTFDSSRIISQEWDVRIETRWSEVVALLLDGD